MTKFEEEFNYLIELSGKVLIGQVDAEVFEKNRVSFFEKYETDQQQALPVVPECVAKTVELQKNYPNFSWTSLYESLGEEGVIWLNEYQQNDEKFGFGGLNNKLFVLFHLAINGYTVEKPQLFYLKNKLTGDCLAICLARASSGLYVEVTEKWLTRKEQTSYKLYFTQQEIDSMETGSYEQIKVEDD